MLNNFTIKQLREDFLSLIGQFQVHIVTSRQRTQDVIKDRRRIATALREKGYSYPDIGFIMNRDHSSIIYLITGKKSRVKDSED